MNKRLGKPKKRLYFIFQHNYFSIKKHTFQSVSVDTVSRIFGHFCFVRWMENSSFARKRRFPRQRLIEKTQLKIIIQKQRRKKRKVSSLRDIETRSPSFRIEPLWGESDKWKPCIFYVEIKTFFFFELKSISFFFFQMKRVASVELERKYE